MSRSRWESNCSRLCKSLQVALAAKDSPSSPQPSADAEKLSKMLFLSNASKQETFREICRSGLILSRAHLAKKNSTQIPPDCAEACLGTTGYVFFYVGAFRYPGTACGFLFRPSLEQANQTDGCASPFDSGALHKHLTLPAGTSTPKDFHARHELPIPEHRELLALFLDLCFSSPSEYVNFTTGAHPVASPYGITGGDFRQFTHEVRIPDQVAIRSDHLEAAFVAGRVTQHPEIEDLAHWCLTNNVEYRAISHPGKADFNRLRQEAINYINQKIY